MARLSDPRGITILNQGMKKIHIKCQGALSIQYSEIEPLQGNLKELSKENYEKLKKEILELGFSEPISVWRHQGKNFTLNGHQRLRVIKQMVETDGFECPPLPVSIIEADSLKEAKKKILALTSQYGQITGQGLYEFASEAGLSAGEIDGSFRFPEIKMDDWKLEFFDEPKGGLCDEDEVPGPPKDPKTRRGDIYQLGAHRLMCGDSTVATDMDALMSGEKGDLLLTDPPYGVSYVEKNAAVHGGIVKNAIGKIIENDSLDVDGMFRLWSDIFGMAGYFEDDASYYVFSPQGGELMMMMMQAIHQSEWKLKHTLIWVKQNFVFGRSDYHYRHEPILYGWKKKGTHNWHSDRKQDSVLEFDKAQRNDLHPTCKPVDLIERLVGNSSKPGDRIVDLFGGSGSTMIAAEKLGRRSFLMELSQSYCDVIVERWEKFTGQKAELLTKDSDNSAKVANG